jgi:hypothetical protein
MSNSKTEDYLKQMNMPKLCARCGQEPGQSKWPIYSRYGFAFRLARTTYKKSRFYVPVCISCKAELERDDSKWLRISWGSGIGAVVMSIMAIFLYQYSAIFLVLSLLALITLLVAYTKRSKYWRDSGIASYDSQYFTFNNQEFHEKFAELNPTLVKKE